MVAGGGRPAGQPHGYFFEPTVLDVPDNSNPAAQDEIFGPVICVLGYRDVDHAVEIANDSVFGLSGQVFGGDLTLATSVAERIRAGAVQVNGGYGGALRVLRRLQAEWHRPGARRRRDPGVPAGEAPRGRQPVTDAGPSVPVFEGVRIVELAQFVFVPACGALLADWGADVIKIEHPVTGDGYRGLVSQGILRLSASGVNQSMEMHNRGKRSIGLDVASAEGRDLLLRLVETADVFLTNFLPSTLAKLRLGVDDLRAVNPKIIYARGHGHGVRGPDADQPAYDATAYWARGGLGATLTPPSLERPISQRAVSATGTVRCSSLSASPARSTAASKPASRRWSTCRCSPPRSGRSRRTCSRRCRATSPPLRWPARPRACRPIR